MRGYTVSMKDPWYGVYMIALAVAGCGDKNHDIQQDAPSGGIDAPGSNGKVAGHARIVVASNAGALFKKFQPQGGGTANIADGRWLLSPDSAKITFKEISLLGAGTNIQAVPLSNCEVTYTRTSSAGTQLLDCPFEAPPGTYLGVGVQLQRISQILISDSTNGLYTDPASSTRLSTSMPAAGAAYVEFRPPGPGGTTGDFSQGGYFAAPFDFGTTPGASTDVYIATDMFHTVYANVAGSTATLDETLPVPPVLVVPSVGAAGREEFYTSTGTALDVMGGGPTENDIYSVRISYPPTSDQPFTSFSPYAGQAFPRDPATSEVYPDSCKRGGYLGLDPSGVVCWAMPADCQYTTYSRLCRLTQQAAIGNTTTLECETRTTVPPPTSGETYASGCPAITPDFTRTVTLVAR